ncbi:Twin arginine-targeting protein translocase, TatA/E family [Streptomyces ambofaciens ATCC 23877]|uniref:Twin arginine-targeting protein translocase, TatA/E family n=1 Tax=Streptomyces ambofaciens (strain ATCC 23877 / 3486 / DSM 40053 / JCM 4204 / NBRC 12836 / NRRL B-2516) TaxID=278992 RepID=A0A0K2AVK2_STRA7|nr:twin-arginine translocase TatA/TatE family subunit [Streptomyces ambofaciens]AKZ56936.1 Twin arginine-targeting protein translocase, TatA/E family [Streptomyces ambofaciens ATCC 23877]
MFGLSELAIILIVVIAVVAARKLPELSRSAGRSARILKAEARETKGEEREPARDREGHRVVRGEAVRHEDTGDTRNTGGTSDAGDGGPESGHRVGPQG